MALALDASTPASVTSNALTITTASFTPPSGSAIYVCCCLNTVNASTTKNHVVSLTDNLGSHLTYTLITKFGTEDGDDSLAYLYAADVVTGGPMTISVAQGATSTGSAFAMLRVLVVTGADTSTTTSAVGAKGGGRGRTTNLSGSAAQYASTRDGSWGWVVYADWSQSGVPVVPAGETVDSSYNPSGQDTYAVVKNDSTTATSGTTVTLTTTTPSSALQLSWIYFEMMPSVDAAIPIGPGLSRNFAFFDRGEYRAATPAYAFMIGIFATHIYAPSATRLYRLTMLGIG